MEAADSLAPRPTVRSGSINDLRPPPELALSQKKAPKKPGGFRGVVFKRAPGRTTGAIHFIARFRAAGSFGL